MSITTTLNSKFNGNKTYVTAAVTALSALASYFLGEITLFQAIQLGVMAAMGAFLRHGLSTDIDAAATKISTEVVKPAA